MKGMQGVSNRDRVRVYAFGCIYLGKYFTYHHKSYHFTQISLVYMATFWMGYWGILPWDVYFCLLRQKIQRRQRKDNRKGNKEGLALKTLSCLFKDSRAPRIVSSVTSDNKFSA